MFSNQMRPLAAGSWSLPCLRISPGGADMRLQESISALWVSTDRRSKHRAAAAAADWTELCLLAKA